MATLPLPRRTAAATAFAVVLAGAPTTAFAADAGTATGDTSAALSGTVAATTAQVNATIQSLLPLRLGNKYLGRTVGIATLDTATGSPIYSRNADRPMLPASNMKIVTALTALKALGPSARFTTSVFAPSPGVLVLRGGGDTMLTTTSLGVLATRTLNSLRRSSLLPAGKPKRPVRVFVDDSLFGTPRRPRGWTDSYQPYVVRPVRSLGRVGVYGWDSAAEAGAVFADALRSRGVKAVTRGRTTVAPGASQVARIRSRSLADQLRYMLLVSENNIAEMLFRHVALATGYPANWRGARLAATKVLSDLGLTTDGLRLRDGSGVSRADRLTPQFLVNLLRLGLDTDRHPEFASFFGSLPVGGRSGTLSAGNGRYTTAPSRCAAGNVFAKTGTLFDTVGLSGYTRGDDGALKIFSILVNDRPQNSSALSTRRAVDGLVATLDGCWTGPKSGAIVPTPTISPSPPQSSEPTQSVVPQSVAGQQADAPVTAVPLP